VISFRSHVVSLMAVFLALAIGVVLGGGPLSEVGRGATAEEVAAAEQDAAHARAGAKAAVAYADQFALATAGRTLANGLEGQTVVVLRLPGAPTDVVTAITGLVDTAGGTVVGSYQVERSLLDPDQSSLVDTLGSQLATTLGNPEVAGLPSYRRIGRLLGIGVATSYPDGSDFDTSAVSVRESLDGAHLAKPIGEPVRRGALVLVVLGDEPPADTGVDTMLGGLTTGLADVARGLVVVGTGGSAKTGILGALRSSDAKSVRVSTTDSVDTGAGQVAAVLALIAAGAGTAGSYGASGSDGAVVLR